VDEWDIIKGIGPKGIRLYDTASWQLIDPIWVR
jgi:hypothetical protein